MGADATPDKPLTKRARRTEEMRRRILDASLRLFIQQGYERTTTRQILNEVGILNGSLYNIYSSKEEIFSDIVMMALEDAVRQTPGFVPAETPPCLKLGFFLNAQIYMSARSPRIAELLMMAYKHWDIHNRATEALREWLESIDHDNSLRSDSPDFMLRLEACMAMTGTYVERLWKRGEFRSPWIWSLIEVFRQLSGTVHSRLMSSPSGGGAARGVHNCGECDRRALDAVERFSFTQDPADLEVECGCRSQWRAYLESERVLGTPADLDRDFENELILRM